MGLVSLPLGATNSGTNDWADVHNEDQAIVDVVNGNIEDSNIASAGLADSSLASPNNSVYKTIFSSSGLLGLDDGAGTYLLGSRRGSAGSNAMSAMLISTGGILLSSTETDDEAPDIFYFDNDDFTVGSLTQKLRLRVQVAANATAPAITFTTGLYPITVAGGADTLAYTAGTVVTSSTVAIASPSASTVTSGVNSDFTIPSDGAYCFAVVTSGGIANNSAVSIHAQLQTRNV